MSVNAIRKQSTDEEVTSLAKSLIKSWKKLLGITMFFPPSTTSRLIYRTIDFCLFLSFLQNQLTLIHEPSLHFELPFVFLVEDRYFHCNGASNTNNLATNWLFWVGDMVVGGMWRLDIIENALQYQ